MRCWTREGRGILLCGHGLLCCAHAFATTGHSPRRFVMNHHVVEYRAEAPLLWIGFESIDSTPCPVPTWCSSLFGSRPWRAGIAGNDDGYLILEWPEGTDLTELSPPGTAVTALSRRAIIATSACPDGSICLRYFAPGYGVAEDAATGSAMRILARYWQERGLCHELHARQCSPEGGLLFSRITEDTTWIGGYVCEDKEAQ